MHYPSGNDSEHPAPLLILLHGYTGTGPGQESYFRLLPHVEAAGFIYAHPTGTINPDGNAFWNATDACCDFYRSGVDDTGYGICMSELDPDKTDTTLTLNDQPPPGGGWFYVVGFREPDGSRSILGTTSDGLSRRPAIDCP